jgi:hypothetical protein
MISAPTTLSTGQPEDRACVLKRKPEEKGRLTVARGGTRRRKPFLEEEKTNKMTRKTKQMKILCAHGLRV